MEKINRGLNIELEKQHQDGTEWQFGALSLPSLVFIPPEEREQYLPVGELQNIGEEKYDCATRAPLNNLETDFTYLYLHTMKPENKKWLEDNRYIQNGKVVFSDRFIALKSGTTKQGNSLKMPLQTIHDCGLVPKSLLPQVATFDEYYDPKCITPDIENLAKEFKKRFTINYEQVRDVLSPELLKEEMLVTAAYAWPSPINGEYPKPADYLASVFNHAFLKIKLPLTYIFDNYLNNGMAGNFIKKLSSNYVFYNYDYRVFISAENVPPPTTTLNDLMQKLYQAILVWFKGAPITQIIPPVAPTQLSTREKLLAEALTWLGKDASPENIATAEFGCAESLSNIIHNVIPKFPSRMVSTAQLANTLDDYDMEFERTLIPKPGCIIVSPMIGTIHGHCGIWTDGQNIMSNDSATGRMQQNYTFDSWVKTFKEGRGLHILIWEPK